MPVSPNGSRGEQHIHSSDPAERHIHSSDRAERGFFSELLQEHFYEQQKEHLREQV